MRKHVIKGKFSFDWDNQRSPRKDFHDKFGTYKSVLIQLIDKFLHFFFFENSKNFKFMKIRPTSKEKRPYFSFNYRYILFFQSKTTFIDNYRKIFLPQMTVPPSNTEKVNNSCKFCSFYYERMMVRWYNPNFYSWICTFISFFVLFRIVELNDELRCSLFHTVSLISPLLVLCPPPFILIHWVIPFGAEAWNLEWNYYI